MKSFALVCALTATTACNQFRAACVLPQVDREGWQEVRIEKSPELSFSLPATFHNESPSGPWFGPGISQIAVQLYKPSNEPLFTSLPKAAGRPEYSKCRERINGMPATIVSYNLRESVGDMAFVGPFQSYAALELSKGYRVLLYGMTDDRRVLNELLAAIRTVRVADSLRVRPNTR